ncbi:MAG: DNA polymerase III subunit beta, partial [Oscillospiraceae bacterium]|nr:DNA polymerase III subunit beta [Oscillospiraceae bacterium]
ILPAKLFADIIRRLPEGPVTVVVDETYKVSIRAGFASFTIAAENADDYPELPDVGEGRGIKIPQNALKQLIGGTIFAVSENQARPIHTGVRFEVEDNAISAIAVDGFRLARRTWHPEAPTGRTLAFVVPAQALKEVEKILADDQDNAVFTLGTKHILFQIGGATLVCRLLDGDFLDWKKVVPTNCPVKLVANVGDLSSSIERVGLIVSEKFKSPVRCIFSNQVLQLRTTTTIGAAEDQCSIAGDGKELEIGFNVRYLADALRAVPSEEVTLELTNGLSPIVLTPVDDKVDFAYMVLPVRLKSN